MSAEAVERCLVERDHEAKGISWLDIEDCENSILSSVRWAGDEHVIVMLGLTPLARPGYCLGAPESEICVRLLSTDHTRYAGSGYPTAASMATEPVPWHRRAQFFVIDLPPLGGSIRALGH